MGLRYDYDIQWVRPDGPPDDGAAPYLAQFRDSATVDALRGADPELQAFFRESGFGLDSYDSGAPEGYFPAVDLSARTDVIERLSENLVRFDFRGKDLNGFDFDAFLDYEVTAQPVDMAAPHEDTGPTPQEPEDKPASRFRLPKFSLARIGAMALLIVEVPMAVSTLLPF